MALTLPQVTLGKDFPNRTLLRRGVELLDDVREVPVAVAHDAAVAERVGQDGRRQRQGGISVAMRCEQILERRAADERQVAGEHDHVAVVRQLAGRHLDRVAGAELFLLLDEDDAIIACHTAERLHDELLAVPDDDDDLVGPGLERRVEQVPEHRPPAHLVQRLGQRRLHPRALAGGEDDG